MKQEAIKEALDLQTLLSCIEVRTIDGNCYTAEYGWAITNNTYPKEIIAVKILMDITYKGLEGPVSTTQRTFIDAENIVVMNIVDNRKVLREKFLAENKPPIRPRSMGPR